MSKEEKLKYEVARLEYANFFKLTAKEILQIAKEVFGENAEVTIKIKKQVEMEEKDLKDFYYNSKENV